MTEKRETASLIVRHLEEHGPCTLETFSLKIPSCTWNQVFAAIDNLSREGTVTLQHVQRFQYRVSLTHRPVIPPPASSLGESEIVRGCSTL
jgi:hypothetical protein